MRLRDGFEDTGAGTVTILNWSVLGRICDFRIINIIELKAGKIPHRVFIGYLANIKINIAPQTKAIHLNVIFTPH